MNVTSSLGDTVIVGVVNITPDSFSDGGRYLSADASIRHSLDLLADGAHIIELGAASSNPDAVPIDSAIELARLQPALTHLLAQGATVGVDSFRQDVQRHAAVAGVHLINDILGFPGPIDPVLAESTCKLVVMHSVQRDTRADRRITDPGALLDTFHRRVVMHNHVSWLAAVSADTIATGPSARDCSLITDIIFAYLGPFLCPLTHLS